MRMRRNRKNVKIKDIAEHLGVSSASVSRALNHKTEHMISEPVVARIKHAARELGYLPNLSAAALRTDRSHIVGVVVPDIMNPVFTAIIKGIQDYLQRNAYVTLIANSDNDQQIALNEVRKLITRQVDGLILAHAFLDDLSVNECLLQAIPTVLVYRSIANAAQVHQILNDDMYGLKLAIEHLKALGHRRLMHLAGPQNILHGKKRLEIFQSLCAQHDLAAEHLILNAFTVDAGCDGARRYLAIESAATAILAGNDLIAVGAIATLRKAGLKVPRDISVVGFNNMPLSDMLSPPLTTIAIPHIEFGNQAARLLLQVIEDREISSQSVLLAPKLVIRDSTARSRPRETVRTGCST